MAEHTRAENRDELIEILREDSTYLQPDLFALYGIRNDGSGFLGWGLQFSHRDHALFYDATHDHLWQSADARTLLARYQQFGEAHLARLD